VAGPAEQCYELTGSSGGSFWTMLRTYRFQWRVLLKNVAYLQVPLTSPELCHVLSRVIKHREIMEKYWRMKNSCVQWVTALEAVFDIL